jgi:IS30 family transposase
VGTARFDNNQTIISISCRSTKIGLEMAKHKTFTVATNVKVYFRDPHSRWQ